MRHVPHYIRAYAPTAAVVSAWVVYVLTLHPFAAMLATYLTVRRF